MIDPEELGLEVFSYSGDEALVLCPFHDDSTPSARFNVETGLFHCFACGVGKSVYDVAEELGGRVVRTTLAPPVTVKSVEPDEWRSRFLNQPLALENVYLQSRKVPDVAVRKLGIREFDDGVIFPMPGTKDGDIIGVQVRYYSRHPKYVFYGKRPPVYPMTGLPATSDLSILTEGVFSVIRGRQAGFDVFAVLGASALAQAIPFFYDRTKVRGVFDPDEAGYVASAKLASIGIPCLVVPFEADEESISKWKKIIPDKRNYSMAPAVFIGYAVKAGGTVRTVTKQILKFEKEFQHGKT